MKKILIDESLHQYKANLHCHSTISDGRLTPAQIKDAYMRHGYSIVAYTDHDIMLPHHDLTDEHFLALTGYEMEVNEDKADAPFKFIKTCHLCFVALDRDKTQQVCWHRENYLFGHATEHRAEADFDESLPDFERFYTPECINEMIRIGRENGFFVTYNHPDWSREDYRDYMQYHGMNAMEMINFGCVIMGYNDHNERVYDDMLRGGEKIFCIATDDNHDVYPEDHPQWDSCGAYTVVLADKLEYNTVTAALSAGQLYASEAPVIKGLTIEDGNVHIECSDCERIECISGIRRGQLRAAEEGKALHAADFTVGEEDVWFRIEVWDHRGRKAYTSAYFTKDLLG